MPLFEYRALQANGTSVQGRLDAGGRQEAFRILEGMGLTPLGLDEKSGAARAAGALFPRRSRRVPGAAIQNFFRQLANLLAAGIPLSRALTLLAKESTQPAVKERWREIHEQVIDGTSLADAMGRFPDTFPRVQVAMVQAGETGGFLDLVLGQVADFLTRDRELRSKVLAAMIYPLVLMFLAAGVVIFLLTFFIPRFRTIFDDFGAPLPLLTQGIIGASNVLLHYGLVAGVVVAAGVVLLRRWLASESGKRSFERFLLRIPVFGPLAASFAMIRFCRMLGTLIESGVSLITALRVACESIGNQTLMDAVKSSIDRVKQGEKLSSSLADCSALFPGSVLEIIAVGEETGRLGTELVRLAGLAEGDLDRQLRTAVSLAEPALLFLMAAFIGTIFIGMVLPIFTLQEYIK